MKGHPKTKGLTHSTVTAKVELRAAYNSHHFSSAGAKQMERQQNGLSRGATDLAVLRTFDEQEKEPEQKKKFITQNYKTEICRAHRQTGICEYKENCQFAHGIQELRPRHFGLKYKTQECKNYHSNGYCRFGSRCKFIHDEHRIRVANDEFWLVSPSENLVRVEVVESPIRQAELVKLFDFEEPTKRLVHCR